MNYNVALTVAAQIFRNNYKKIFSILRTVLIFYF